MLALLPEIVKPIAKLGGIMVQPCFVPGAVAIFRIAGGALSGPAPFTIQPAEHTKSQSMESRIEQAWAALPAATPRSSLETMEHLALLKRWFYRSSDPY